MGGVGLIRIDSECFLLVICGDGAEIRNAFAVMGGEGGHPPRFFQRFDVWLCSELFVLNNET